MLTASFLRGLEVQLGKKLKQKLHIRRVSPISGGSINHAARVDTTFGTFFLKANDAFQYPLMFDKEANGLQLLRGANLFTIPEVILVSEEEALSFLLLRHIESKLMAKDFWERFGTSLGKLHRHSSPRFGFNEANDIENVAGVVLVSKTEAAKQPRVSVDDVRVPGNKANLLPVA